MSIKESGFWERGLRRSRWVRPGLQLRVILAALSVAVLVLLLNYVFLSFSLLEFKNPPSDPAAEVVRRTRSFLFQNTLLSLAAAIPLSVLFGVFVSFRFCGPIFRFKRYFSELLSGRWDRNCQLRKGDNLQDLKEAINATLEAMREMMLEQHELLSEFVRLVESRRDTIGDHEAVERLLGRSHAHAKEMHMRFEAEVAAEPEAASTT